MHCNKCRKCEKNLIITKKTNEMMKDKEYVVTMENGEKNIGSKDYYQYMDRYGDVIGVCEETKCTD